MTDDGSSADYENGMADILGFLAGPKAQVERNVKLYGRRSKINRQIDVLVTTRQFPLGEVRVVVDCKRRTRRLDISDAEEFQGFLEDVGADGGVLVTTQGLSKAAQDFATQARGLKFYILSPAEMKRWTPAGTATRDYQISETRQIQVSRRLRRAGFRVCTSSNHESTIPGEVVISIFRHFSNLAQQEDEKTEAFRKIESIIQKLTNRTPFNRGSSFVTGGGTPGHRWLEVTQDGRPIETKILAATEHEIDINLTTLAHNLGNVPRDTLDVIRPTEWPVDHVFGSWGDYSH